MHCPLLAPQKLVRWLTEERRDEAYRDGHAGLQLVPLSLVSLSAHTPC